MRAKFVMISVLGLSGLCLSLTCSTATAQRLDKATACLEMSSHAKRFFSVLQKLDVNNPGNRKTYIEAIRELNFEQYKKNVESSGQSSAHIWELQRQWGDIGINEFEISPNSSPEAAERSIYERCINSRAP